MAQDAGHRPVRMFCIKDGRVYVAEPETGESHLEWFRNKKWIKDNGGDEEKVFHHIVSGYYVPDEGAVYVFREMDFEPNEETVKEVSDVVMPHLAHLKIMFTLGDHTEVFAGMPGSTKLIGKIDALIERAEGESRSS